MKLINNLLAVLLCLSFAFCLVACDEHDHTYEETWTNNSTHHWHQCVTDGFGSGCDSTSDKAEHTWGKSVDSEDTYLCTVCGALKGYPVDINEWTAALDEALFTNITVKYSIKEDDVTKNYVAKIANGEIYVSEEVDGTVTENWYEDEEADTQILTVLSYFTAPMVNSYYKFLPYIENGEGYYLTSDIISELTGEQFGNTGMLIGSVSMSTQNQYVPGQEFVTYSINEKGRIRFDSEGNLILFSATVKKVVSVVEVIELGEGNSSYRLTTLSETIQELSFEFSDYGTTIIPAK